MTKKKSSEFKCPLNLTINADMLFKFKTIVDVQHMDNKKISMNSVIANYIQHYVTEYNDLFEAKIKADKDFKQEIKKINAKRQADIEMKKNQTELNFKPDTSTVNSSDNVTINCSIND